jgi:hypothetical protein
MRRYPSDSGIAIGPILFVIALLGILAAVISAGSGEYGNASIADRVYADTYSQANLIRSKINECNMKYGTSAGGDGYPAVASEATGVPVCSLTCVGDPNTAETGNDCAGNPMTQQNMWYGIRPALLPPPTMGFNQWYYTNGGVSGGHCIWTQPTGSASAGIIEGLTHTATKFSSQEVTYNSAGSTNRFVVWITVPTGSPAAPCVSN